MRGVVDTLDSVAGTLLSDKRHRIGEECACEGGHLRDWRCRVPPDMQWSGFFFFLAGKLAFEEQAGPCGRHERLPVAGDVQFCFPHSRADLTKMRLLPPSRHGLDVNQEPTFPQRSHRHIQQ